MMAFDFTNFNQCLIHKYTNNKNQERCTSRQKYLLKLLLQPTYTNINHSTSGDMLYNHNTHHLARNLIFEAIVL